MTSERADGITRREFLLFATYVAAGTLIGAEFLSLLDKNTFNPDRFLSDEVDKVSNVSFYLDKAQENGMDDRTTQILNSIIKGDNLVHPGNIKVLGNYTTNEIHNTDSKERDSIFAEIAFQMSAATVQDIGGHIPSDDANSRFLILRDMGVYSHYIFVAIPSTSLSEYNPRVVQVSEDSVIEAINKTDKKNNGLEIWSHIDQSSIAKYFLN